VHLADPAIRPCCPFAGSGTERPHILRHSAIGYDSYARAHCRRCTSNPAHREHSRVHGSLHGGQRRTAGSFEA